jgi:hypothetical protein
MIPHYVFQEKGQRSLVGSTLAYGSKGPRIEYWHLLSVSIEFKLGLVKWFVGCCGRIFSAILDVLVVEINTHYELIRSISWLPIMVVLDLVVF